jgi:hypothetical protein
MNTTALIRVAIAILMPASLCAADSIMIETKIIQSEVTKITHNLREVAKLKGVDLLSAPPMTIEFAKNGRVEIIREYQPPSAANQKFECSSIGVTISVTPERQGEDIAFKGCLTMTQLVGEANIKHQAQSETVTRTIYFSGMQKRGEEGWFDLVNPTNGSTQKKITVWIRFEQPKAEQNGGGQTATGSESKSRL